MQTVLQDSTKLLPRVDPLFLGQLLNRVGGAGRLKKRHHLLSRGKTSSRGFNVHALRWCEFRVRRLFDASQDEFDMFDPEYSATLLLLFYLPNPLGFECLYCSRDNVKNFFTQPSLVGCVHRNRCARSTGILGIFQQCAGAVTAAL